MHRDLDRMRHPLSPCGPLPRQWDEPLSRRQQGWTRHRIRGLTGRCDPGPQTEAVVHLSRSPRMQNGARQPSRHQAPKLRRCGGVLGGLRAGLERESALSCSSIQVSRVVRRYMTRPRGPRRKLGGPCRRWRQTFSIQLIWPGVFSSQGSSAATSDDGRRRASGDRVVPAGEGSSSRQGDLHEVGGHGVFASVHRCGGRAVPGVGNEYTVGDRRDTGGRGDPVGEIGLVRRMIIAGDDPVRGIGFVE